LPDAADSAGEVEAGAAWRGGADMRGAKGRRR
jgi:hypothetical protein